MRAQGGHQGRRAGRGSGTAAASQPRGHPPARGPHALSGPLAAAPPPDVHRAPVPQRAPQLRPWRTWERSRSSSPGPTASPDGSPASASSPSPPGRSGPPVQLLRPAWPPVPEPAPRAPRGPHPTAPPSAASNSPETARRPGAGKRRQAGFPTRQLRHTRACPLSCTSCAAQPHPRRRWRALRRGPPPTARTAATAPGCARQAGPPPGSQGGATAGRAGGDGATRLRGAGRGPAHGAHGAQRGLLLGVFLRRVLQRRTPRCGSLLPFVCTHVADGLIPPELTQFALIAQASRYTLRNAALSCNGGK
jgi:hypothetical protein